MVQGQEPGGLDRWLTVVTPESTVLRLTLAGPGSRFAAALLDALAQGLVLAVLAAGAFLLARGDVPALAAFTVRYVWPLALGLAWLVLWAWHALFETCWNGQTPGKRALRLRVLTDGGYAVGFSQAALRNLLRVVDLLPLVTPYLLGALTMAWSPRGKRLGDLAAGTVVVRERPTPWVERLVSAPAAPAGEAAETLTAAHLAALSDEAMAVVAAYLRRRDGLPLDRRRALAGSVAGPLRERLAIPAAGVSRDRDEAFLEALWAAWAGRRRRW